MFNFQVRENRDYYDWRGFLRRMGMLNIEQGMSNDEGREENH
jgi:hypothetical protein